MYHPDKFCALILLLVLVYTSVTIYNLNPLSILTRSFDMTPEQTVTKISITSFPKKNLVIYNAIGRVENLPLIVDSRSNIFPPSNTTYNISWDCVAFMYVSEKMIPDDNLYLLQLRKKLNCTIVRSPGIHWGTFLLFLTPEFVSHYQYISLILDDIYIPHSGTYAVNSTTIIHQMERLNIDVFSPSIVRDHHKTMDPLFRMDEGCVVRIKTMETFVQIFTREAWNCFYKMLHHSGERGWCYDICYNQVCPNLTLAVDFHMRAYHTDSYDIRKDYSNVLRGTGLEDYKPGNKIKELGYFDTDPYAICHKWNCNKNVFQRLDMIECDATTEHFSRAEITI